MADDADKSTDLAGRLAAPRAPAERASYFECFPTKRPPRPRKVVLRAFADRWIALGWVFVEDSGGKVTIEWRGGGEPAEVGR